MPFSFIVSCSLPFSALPLIDEQHERHLVRKKEQNPVVVIVKVVVALVVVVVVLFRLACSYC